MNLSFPQNIAARMLCRGLSLAAILAFAVLSSVARADSVPSATFSGSVSQSNASLSGPGTLNGALCFSGPFGGCENSSVTLSYSGGTASASANGTTSGGNGVPNATAGGTVIFYFIVSGPANTEVPLIVTASGSTSASGVDVISQSQFMSPGGSFDACSSSGAGAAGACSNGTGGVEPTSYSGQKLFSVSSDTLEDIEVIVSGASSSGSGTWSASVDPTVEINPDFADAAEFTIEFSPNVAPANMPEPPTWTLLLIGMAALFRVTHTANSR
jgi:hypothetical protein